MGNLEGESADLHGRRQRRDLEGEGLCRVGHEERLAVGGGVRKAAAVAACMREVALRSREVTGDHGSWAGDRTVEALGGGEVTHQVDGAARGRAAREGRAGKRRDVPPAAGDHGRSGEQAGDDGRARGPGGKALRGPICRWASEGVRGDRKASEGIRRSQKALEGIGRHLKGEEGTRRTQKGCEGMRRKGQPHSAPSLLVSVFLVRARERSAGVAPEVLSTMATCE